MSNEKGRKKEIVLAVATCILAITASVLTGNLSPAVSGMFFFNGLFCDWHIRNGFEIRGVDKNMEFEGNTLFFPEQIDGEPVTQIYLGHIFYGKDDTYLNDQITNLSIPAGVQYLSLTDFSEMESINIHDGITSLVLTGCDSLTNIEIPDGVEYLDLRGCKSLTSVDISNVVTERYNRYGRLYHQTEIYLSGCESLTSVRIPYGAPKLVSDMFKGCSSLTDVEIPDSVTEINDGAFAYCASLTSVVIPDSVEYINGTAFDGCDSLSVVSLPAGIEIAGDCSWSDKIVYRVLN